MTDKKKPKSSSGQRNRNVVLPAQQAPVAHSPQPAANEQTAPRALFTAPIDVRWRDLDAFNHVNNSSYLTFLEEARLQWLRTIEGEWFDEHAMPVLAAAELNYRAPIAWPARVEVELACERLGNSSITVGHRIVDAGDSSRVYCDGRTVLVWADPATGASVPLPHAIRKACSL